MIAAAESLPYEPLRRRAPQANAYSNQVRAQTGKSLSAEHATVLLELIEAL